MPRRKDDDNDANDPSAPTTFAEESDSGDVRTFEPEDAEAVRKGELSAAQMAGGHGNVDPSEPDAQYPPGVVDNSAATLNTTDDPASFVPERRTDSGYRTTAATPDYGTNAEE